ncbi:leucine-rich repeat and calponin homology domain-containing protein 1 isoform X4 [Alosa sapidissima]|uniref:leucine-rich repeat and calponin homology domain-containing protein 1 isoform X4 n=1 Tax=Alosa sapidissima TaxID=34773 RepID=UPI001C08AABD|nr:leucine-rich repeat and calponin homology domain-containing protein 1 isoform X4 [Alosa sapidissima]
MTTLAPEPRPHTQLASAAAGATLGGVGSGTSVSLNRGLERALEEAASSGRLNLSSRKLKEFPKSAANYDLTDTVDADLSKNRLTDVPSEVCHLVALETLNLYHNCIKSVPDSLITLHTLTNLNLSRNQLCVLPACVCGLPLRVLNVSNNKLNTLPDCISQLHTLMELDVSCNEITALPRHIGRLRALRELNVRRNLLCVLPDDLAYLPLVKFDFSCNKVSTIPTCFRKMLKLQIMQLDHNPLQSPPAQVCMRGMVHIFKYLALEACRGEKLDVLYLPVNDKLRLSRPGAGSVEDMGRKHDSDSGLGSDNGDKRLSATEPSDEDSLSVQMSHIREEEGLNRDDSTDQISSLTDPACVLDRSPSDSLQLSYQESELNSPFINYIKSRAGDFDEPLRIEEDINWATETTAEVQLIQQLKEAVELLQHPSRVNMTSGVRVYPAELVSVEESLNGQESENGTLTPKKPSALWEFQKVRVLILERAKQEAQLACGRRHTLLTQTGQRRPSEESGAHSSRTEGNTPATFSLPPFGLKPRSAPSSMCCSPPPQNLSILPATPPNATTGAEKNVFLRSHKSAEAVDPQFTMRRKMEQLREEMEQMEQLRQNIESRLKVSLPEDLGSALMDGVVLCHLANHIRPRSIASIHVPSPAVPKLSMAKCRRNVENFLDACRKMGVPESSLCSAYDVLQCRLRPVGAAVCSVLECVSTAEREGEGGKERREDGEREKGREVEREKTSLAPPPTWRIWDLIGSSLLHLLCLLLLFLAYSWSELT